jgi:integrase
VLPSANSATKPISENTFNNALRRLGFGKHEATAHGFRATARTLLEEEGRYPIQVIERQLSHEEPNETRRAYARSKYWDERVAMMQWWADYLEGL